MLAGRRAQDAKYSSWQLRQNTTKMSLLVLGGDFRKPERERSPVMSPLNGVIGRPTERTLMLVTKNLSSNLQRFAFRRTCLPGTEKIYPTDAAWVGLKKLEDRKMEDQKRTTVCVTNHFISNCPLSVPTRQVWKSVNIWQIYGQYTNWDVFLRDSCIDGSCRYSESGKWIHNKLKVCSKSARSCTAIQSPPRAYNKPITSRHIKTLYSWSYDLSSNESTTSRSSRVWVYASLDSCSQLDGRRYATLRQVVACKSHGLLQRCAAVLEVCGKDYSVPIPSHSHKTIPIPTHSHDKNLFPFPFFPDTTILDSHSHYRHEIFRNIESQEMCNRTRSKHQNIH